MQSQPNVIILFSDDAGYADFSMNGSTTFKTPHIDGIANSGMTFTNGYVSGSVCSPSRAGLLTGRYQQRFGHECNLGDNYGKTEDALLGIPVSEITLASILKREGYKTGMIGKWHLGEEKQFHPCNRGFDDFFGMLGGGSPYLPGKATNIIRNYTKVDYLSLPYLTDAFGDEACMFIEKNKNNPFFLYLSFNAPHTPMHAKIEYLNEQRVHFKTEERAINAAMTQSLDENVGKVMDKLKSLGLEDNTIIFFTNDNGGAMPYNASCNDPFSGTKGTFLEGGIHVPFVMQWKGMIEAGSTYTKPVITLDILPTVVNLVGGELPLGRIYDGIDLMPYMTGKEGGYPHPLLFWRMHYQGAIRNGDWKLIWFEDQAHQLYNLKVDIEEKYDLADQYPEKVKALLQQYEEWEKEMIDPLWINNPCWKEHSWQRYDRIYVNSLKTN